MKSRLDPRLSFSQSLNPAAPLLLYTLCHTGLLAHSRPTTVMATMLDQPIICPIIVGRDAALDAVGRCLDQARQGARLTLLVTGEAGIGKSRLVADAKARAQRLGFEILQGHCFEPDRSLPFAPTIDLLQSFATASAPGELAETLNETAPALLQLLPEIAARSRVADLPNAFDPEQDRRRLFDAFVALLREMSIRAPLLVIFEDLHWSDDASLEGLLHLAHRIAPFPILLLLTYRNDEIQPALAHVLAELDRRRLGLELRLDRLSAADIDAMVRAIFEVGRPIRADLLEKISTLTDGNPFFVEETLKALVAEGEIYFADGAWNRKNVSNLRVPRSVQDTVRLRVERISPAAQRLIELAAVTGRGFDFGLLQDLMKIEEDELLAEMKELLAAQLVVEESADRFAFRHALTRQAIYSGLLARERQTLHRRVGEAIERRYGVQTDAHIADLALHFAEAADWQKTLEYARRAGVRAQAMYSPRAAVEHFTRALDAADALGLPLQPDLYRARGQSFETLGEFESARADHEKALAASRSINDRDRTWQAHLDLGFLWASRDYSTSGEYFAEALALAREIGDPLKVASSLNRVGNWYMNTGHPHEACRFHEEALAAFREAGDRQGIADSLDLLAMSRGQAGDASDAVRTYDQVITLYREIGDRRGLVNSLIMSALLAVPHPIMLDVSADLDVEVALARVDESVAIARDIGWRSGEAFALLDSSYCFYAVGDYGRALQAVRGSLRISEEIDHKQWQAGGQFSIGAMGNELGVYDAAQRQLEHAAALAQEVGSLYWFQLINLSLARAHSLKGDHTGAEAIIDAIHDPDKVTGSWFDRLSWLARTELALNRGDPATAFTFLNHLPSASAKETAGTNPMLLAIRGRVLAALSRVDEAVSVLERAEHEAQRRQGRALLWRIYVVHGQAELARSSRTAASEAFAKARAVVSQIVATIPEEPIPELGIASARDQFIAATEALMPTKHLPTALKAAKQSYDGLTARERDVASLIARGMSNRAIADELIVSERTVASHVANILSKLSFSSRSQVAVWATEKGLTRQGVDESAESPAGPVVR